MRNKYLAFFLALLGLLSLALAFIWRGGCPDQCRTILPGEEGFGSSFVGQTICTQMACNNFSLKYKFYALVGFVFLIIGLFLLLKNRNQPRNKA